MCTLTWSHDRRGRTIVFSRDERRTRAAAEPPTRRERRGVAFLAPADGDAGGAWIATNARGATFCLLNGYGAPERAEPAGGWRSRGEVVLDVAHCGFASEARRELEATDLADVRPFALAVFDREDGPLVIAWDGDALSEPERVAPPIVSSSFESDDVRAARADLFGRTAALDGDLLAFHASHDPEPGPFSVCMHRDDASTVSLSVVRVEPGLTTFRYVAGAPCDPRARVVEATLERAPEPRCSS